MYARFMLMGDRLHQRWSVDPTVSSVPEKPRQKPLPPPADRRRPAPISAEEEFLRNGGFSG